MKKIISISVIVVIVLASVSLFVMYKMGDRVFSEAITSEIKQLEKDLEDDVKKLEDSLKLEDTTKPVDSSGMVNGGSNSGKTQGEKPATGKVNTPSLSKTEKEALEVKIKKTKENIDTLKKVQDEISVADKMEASMMVAKRLQPEDIAQLEGFITGDFTPEEKAKAKAIAYERFTPEELSRIKELYHKYIK